MAQNRYVSTNTPSGTTASTKVGASPEPRIVTLQGSRSSLSQVGGVGRIQVTPHGDQRILNQQTMKPFEKPIPRKPNMLESVGGFFGDIGKGAYREVEAYHPGYFTGELEDRRTIQQKPIVEAGMDVLFGDMNQDVFFGELDRRWKHNPGRLIGEAGMYAIATPIRGPMIGVRVAGKILPKLGKTGMKAKKLLPGPAKKTFTKTRIKRKGKKLKIVREKNVERKGASSYGYTDYSSKLLGRVKPNPNVGRRAKKYTQADTAALWRAGEILGPQLPPGGKLGIKRRMRI